MARRGVMTALQAALAGIGGAAGGYVQQEELKRRRQEEDEERKRRQALEEAGIRAEQRDILRSGGTQIAGMGEQVAGPVPSAIPLSGVGNAFAAAEQAGGPATSRGAMRQTVGGQEFMLPSAAEGRAQALENALAQARAEREVLQQFKTEDTIKAERSAFNALKKAGQVKGAFDQEYGQYGADLEDYRAIRRTLATQRAATPRVSRQEQLTAFIDKQIADEVTRMAREGKPGVTPYSPRTPYTQKDLTDAAKNMRAALTEAFKEAAAPAVDQSTGVQPKVGTDTTATGSPVQPKTPRDSVIPDTLGRLGIDFSDRAYADTLKTAKTATPAAAATIAPPAAAPADTTRPTGEEFLRRMRDPKALEASKKALEERSRAQDGRIQTYRLPTAPTAADRAAADFLENPTVLPARDTVATRLPAALAPRGRGEEIGMPAAPVRRPEAPARPLPYNPESPEGIGSIPVSPVARAFQQAEAPAQLAQLSPRRRKAAEADLARYAQVEQELAQAQQSTVFGRSLDILVLESELAKIRRRLGIFGITPPSTP